MLREASKLLRHSLSSNNDPAAISFKPEASTSFSTRDLEEVMAHATPKHGRSKKEHRARPSEERPASILEKMGHIALRQSTTKSEDDKKPISPGKEGADPEISPTLAQTSKSHPLERIPAMHTPPEQPRKAHSDESSDSQREKTSSDVSKEKKPDSEEKQAEAAPSKAHTPQAESSDSQRDTTSPIPSNDQQSDSEAKHADSEVKHAEETSSKSPKPRTEESFDSHRGKASSSDSEDKEAEQEPSSDAQDVTPKLPRKDASDAGDRTPSGSKDRVQEEVEEKKEKTEKKEGDAKRSLPHSNPYKALSTGGLPRKSHAESKLGALQRKAQSVRLPSERTTRIFRSSRDATSFSFLLEVCKQYPSDDLRGTAEALLGSTAEFKAEQAEETIQFEVLTDRHCDILRVRSQRSRRCSFSFGPHYLLATGVRSTTTWIAHSTLRKSYPFADHSIMAGELEKCETLLGESQLDMAKQYLPGKMSDNLAKLHLQTPSGSPVFRVPSHKKGGVSHKGRANRLMMETAFRLCKQPLRDAITAFDLELALKRASVIDSSASSRRLFDIASSLDADATGFLEYNEFYLFCHYITAVQVRKMTILTCPGYLLLGSTWTPVIIDVDLYEHVLSIYANPSFFKMSPLDRSEIHRLHKHSKDGKDKEKDGKDGKKNLKSSIPDKHQLHGVGEQAPRSASGHAADKKNKETKHRTHHKDNKQDEADAKLAAKAGKEKAGRDPISAAASSSAPNRAEIMLQKVEEEERDKPMTAYERSKLEDLKKKLQADVDAQKDFLPDLTDVNDPNRKAQSSKVRHEQPKEDEIVSAEEDDEHKDGKKEDKDEKMDDKSSKHHEHHDHHHAKTHGHAHHQPHHQQHQHGHDHHKAHEHGKKEHLSDSRIWDIRQAAAFERDEIEHRVVFTLELHGDEGSHELSMVVGDSDVADFGDSMRFLMACWEYQKADRENVEDLLLGQLARTAVHSFFV